MLETLIQLGLGLTAIATVVTFEGLLGSLRTGGEHRAGVGAQP